MDLPACRVILGVKTGATEKELKDALRDMRTRFHPDKNVGDEKWANDQFIKVTQAYDILMEELTNPGTKTYSAGKDYVYNTPPSRTAELMTQIHEQIFGK